MSDLNKLIIIDQAAKSFKKSSRCRLHRDTTSNKCKILLLGDWVMKYSQKDIPLDYLRLTNCLDMLVVRLTAKYATTKSFNGDNVTKIVKAKIN